MWYKNWKFRRSYVVASIIENGKLPVKATNVGDSLCGIDMIISNTEITVGSFANSMNEFIFKWR